MLSQLCLFVFFFNDTATTEIYTLSLHDALPIFTLCCFLGHMYHFLLPDARCTPTLLAHSELRKVDPSATPAVGTQQSALWLPTADGLWCIKAGLYTRRCSSRWDAR